MKIKLIINLIKAMNPDILNIKEYTSEEDIVYFIGETKSSFKVFERNGEFIRNCPSWISAVDLCDWYSGYEYDNWLIQGYDPNSRSDMKIDIIKHLEKEIEFHKKAINFYDKFCKNINTDILVSRIAEHNVELTLLLKKLENV